MLYNAGEKKPSVFGARCRWQLIATMTGRLPAWITSVLRGHSTYEWIFPTQCTLWRSHMASVWVGWHPLCLYLAPGTRHLSHPLPSIRLPGWVHWSAWVRLQATLSSDYYLIVWGASCACTSWPYPILYVLSRLYSLATFSKASHSWLNSVIF